MDEDLFPEIVAVVPSDKPTPCEYPYFVVAYWPPGKKWVMQDVTYSSLQSTYLSANIEALKSRGWTHITILKLPSALWERAK